MLTDTMLDNLIAVVGLLWASTLGHYFTVQWNIRQKKRELALVASREFHKLYGIFFSLWKKWEYLLKTTPDGSEERRKLLFEACDAEGNVESLFVALSSSHELTDDQITTLGLFRQGYQSLRQAIREGRSLGWDSSDHMEYVAFKRLATEVATLIVSDKSDNKKKVKSKGDKLLRITCNSWERKWTDHHSLLGP